MHTVPKPVGVAKVAVAILAVLATSCSRSDRVSVALVIVDTLRADHLGSYGGTTPTPHLDRLAREGTLFMDATAHTPLTLPSHASILTGTYPVYHGVRDNGRYKLPEEIDTLAEMLKGSGYATAAFVGGYPVHSRFGLSQGYDYYDDSFLRTRGEKTADEVVTAAREWLGKQPKGEPFFLWIHLFDPHSPYKPPESFRTQHGNTYGGEVAYVDDALGRLFSSLGDNVLTVFTSDHGEGLGEHGEDTHALFIYDSTLRVPLVFQGLGVPRGAVIREPVRSIDIVPSILDLLGQEDSCTACQGRSLVPQMQGEEIRPEASYAESFFPRLNLGWSELRSLRHEGWKYIAAPEPELYNLTSDPEELENLAKDEPEKIEELAAKLSALEEEEAGSLDVQPVTPDQKTLKLLRSLGYVSTGQPATREGPLPDPKDRIGLWQSFIKGIEHSDEGRLDEAIRELETVLQQDSGMLAARGYLSEAYFRRGRYEDAAQECQEYLDADPSDFQATYLMAESLLRLGRVSDAVQAFEDAAKLDTGAAGPLARLANVHLREGNTSEARRVIDAALERDSRDASVLLVQGKLLMAEGKLQEAEKAFSESLAVNPSEIATQLQLGGLLLQQDRPEEAEDLLNKSVAQHPQSAILYVALGRAQALSGHEKQAIQSFQKSLELNPNQPELRRFLEQYRSQ